MKTKKIKLKEFRKKMEELVGYRLVTISALDSKGCFNILYHFDKDGINTFKVLVSEKKPFIKSITDIFPSAEFYEREIYDFFGIEFEGNPRLHHKMFLPDDWKEKPPLLRKK